jgi:hypothetical protein
MKAGRFVLAALLLFEASARAQENAAAAPAETDPTGWEFNASLYGYFPPNDRHYAQPTFIADRGALHLEGRYNYEGFKTGSAWVGWNLEAGDEKKLHLEATLLAGGVFGDTRGVAPGYEMTLSYGRFELYSEGEYVFDTGDSDNSFFYNWAQLGFSATDWLALGLASQRTRAYHTSLDVQRGVFAAFNWKKLTLSVYVFNPGWETPTVVSSLAFAF